MSHSSNSVRERPALFRALGKCGPPQRVDVDGRALTLEEVLKHDSWAATAIYAEGRRRIICKFNRRQSIFGLPTGWLGRLLARREGRALARTADTGLVPLPLGAVTVDGKSWPNAVARVYLDGHPLGRYERVDDAFFPTLRSLLGEMHRRGMAYIDLHKRENILVGDDGRPYLIDFQVHLSVPAWLVKRLPWTARLLAPFYRMDRYHVLKHEERLNRSLGRVSREDVVRNRPLLLRIHRVFAEPLRQLRRGLLVRLGIRAGDGKSLTEAFPEDAVRREIESTTESKRAAA